MELEVKSIEKQLSCCDKVGGPSSPGPGPLGVCTQPQEATSPTPGSSHLGFVETRQKLGAVPWKETQRWEAPGKAGGVREAGVRMCV